MDNSEKLNIENTDTIDMLYENGGTLTLEIIDGMDWSDEARHLTLLQSKLNSYIRFIDTKQYEEKHPNVTAFIISLRFCFAETPTCLRFLDLVSAKLDDFSPRIDICVEHGMKD